MPYWRLSGVYFTYFAVVGALAPFWGLYLQSLGFNAHSIGIISAIPLVTKLGAPNLWGWLADCTGKQLLIIRLGALGAALFFVGVMLNQSFWLLVTYIAVYSFFWNAILPQFEVVTLRYLGARPHDYSKVRLWGSVGFIVAVLGLGYFFDSYKITVLPNIIFILLCLIVCFVCVLPKQKPYGEHLESFGFLQKLQQPHVIVFFLVLFFLQFSHGAYYVFYSIYLDQWGYSKSLIGVLWTIGVVCEIVIFICMVKIFARFSFFYLLTLSLLLTVLRWCLIGFAVENIYLIVFSQTLHAFSFGMVHAIAIEFIRKTFGEKTQSQGQAFYSAVTFGGGSALGVYVSGALWHVSSQLVFTVAAVAAVISLILTIVFLKSKL